MKADNNQVRTDLRSERAGFRVDFGQGGRVSGLGGQISGLRGQIQGLRGHISGLRRQILCLRGQILGLRGPGGNGQKNGRTDGRNDERKSPCVLQDFVPFGAAALLPLTPFHNHAKQGNMYY